MSTTETWLPVVGLEDWYEVSSLGAVRRVRGGKGCTAGRVLRPRVNDDGYLCLSLSKLNVSTSHRVHVLVAAAFCGPTPEGMEINHIDTNKRNCAVENLEFMTHLENVRHAQKMGVTPRMTGDRNGSRRQPHRRPRGIANKSSKLTEDAVREIRVLLTHGIAKSDIGERFGVSRTIVRHIQRGKLWGHVA